MDVAGFNVLNLQMLGGRSASLWGSHYEKLDLPVPDPVLCGKEGPCASSSTSQHADRELAQAVV